MQQKNIEKLSVEDGGHFVLQVKKNNPTLYEEIITAFSAFEKEIATDEKERTQRLKQYIEKYERWYSQEKNRERIEYREEFLENGSHRKPRPISTMYWTMCFGRIAPRQKEEKIIWH